MNIETPFRLGRRSRVQARSEVSVWLRYQKSLDSAAERGRCGAFGAVCWSAHTGASEAPRAHWKASKGVSGYRQRRRFDFVCNRSNRLRRSCVPFLDRLFWIASCGSSFGSPSASPALSATHLLRVGKIHHTILHSKQFNAKLCLHFRSKSIN